MIVLGHLTCFLLNNTIIIGTVDWTPVSEIYLREEGRPCGLQGRCVVDGHLSREKRLGIGG